MEEVSALVVVLLKEGVMCISISWCQAFSKFRNNQLEVSLLCIEEHAPVNMAALTAFQL